MKGKAGYPPTSMALAFALPSLVVGCGPDAGAFYGKTYYCDTSQPKTQCGTSRKGEPLTCFAGRQLGNARDFCVEQCSVETDFSEDGDSVCLAARSKLRTCHPSDRSTADPDGCGPDLACYRTDLVRDEGVCLAMRVCSADADCTDPALSTCAATVLKQLFPEAPFLASNLQCVVGGCKSKQMACPLGEACLPTVAPAGSVVPDICVPSCDGSLNCPPNYFCWRRLSGPVAPAICLPGLQSARCTNSLDCMVGDCVDTKEGFSLCSVGCERDQDCLVYSDTSQRLYCLPDPTGSRKHCVSPAPFAGGLCLTDEGCPAPQRCYFSSPFHAQPQVPGDCRLPCGPDDHCPVRGGVAHACFVRGGERSCYPGRLGLPCRSSDQCLPAMSCQEVGPEQRLPGMPQASPICTLACTSDADCDVALGPSQEGYCEAGWCRLGGGPGDPCTRDGHCRGSGRCAAGDGGAGGTCAY